MKVEDVKGFSLVELMIILAIMGIVAAIATPNFMAYRDNTSLKDAARGISSDIYYYKQRATAENLGYRINFNAANTYTIQQETTVNSAVFTDLTTKMVSPDDHSIVISGTPSFDSGVTYITFDTRGTTSTTCSNNCTVVLLHDKRLSTATITTNVMGRVSVVYALK